MRMRKLFYISVLLLSFCACKKENNANSFQGSYQGTFRSSVNNQYTISEAEIELSSPNFKVNKGPKLGSGVFKVEDKMHITFTDKNVWTTDGEYKYEALGDSLILTKYVTGPTNGINYYQYRLKRAE